MSGAEDLYLHQSDAEALFFPDALLDNADELDFESFGDASGLDDGAFAGPGLTSRDIFKSIGESFVGDAEAKSVPDAQVALARGAPYSNGSLHMFNKPTLDLEGMGMAYGIYLQGNGVTSPSGLLSPSSEKLNGLTLGQMAPPFCPFVSSPQTSQAVPPANGMSRFGSQEILMSTADASQSTSPTLSPNSSDGKEQVERLISAENGMKMAQEKPFFGVMQPDTANFVDQVDGDGDGLQPLPQIMRPSMQRSFSSHALGGLRHMGSAPASSENGVNSRHSQVDRPGGLASPGARLQQPNLAEFHSIGMRRVYSTGDIQTLNGMRGGLSGGASPSFEDSNYRVGKYSMEERKIRIHRYQQKRTQRNFNKKIKYACRKTLADSRPRVRGRFAKNMDDDLPTAVLGRKREDDDDEEVGGEANGYHFDNSSGEYSDMLTSIKLEHRTVNSM